MRRKCRLREGFTAQPRARIRCQALADSDRIGYRFLMAKRVLIVDDDRGVAEFLADVCRLDGCEVDTAMSGTEALVLLERHTYDAALLDARMPVLDGPTLYHSIEQFQPGLRRRMAFITGDVLNGELRQCLLETGAPVMEKPLHATEVLRLLRLLLAA